VRRKGKDSATRTATKSYLRLRRTRYAARVLGIPLKGRPTIKQIAAHFGVKPYTDITTQQAQWRNCILTALERYQAAQAAQDAPT
jgi:hypothetical protein